MRLGVDMDMKSEEPSIAEVVESYRTSVYSKNIDAFVALYRDDVTVFDMWGRWSYDGAEAWRAMVVDWFGSLGDDRVEVKFEDVRTTVAGDLSILHAFITITGLSAEGQEMRSMSNRLTWALQREADGLWKILHEHTSAPADFETGKVTLRK
jgi:uncharacterized protein (TIGR02246 family)